MSAPDHWHSPLLAEAPAVHGFFGRPGGVSRGIYAALNCGYGSMDDPGAVRENRARAQSALIARGAGAITPETPIATPHQVHGTTVVHVTEAWAPGAGPRADGVVTDRPGIVLGILSADCAPVLLIDPEARVIGALHAGWRGALAGIAEATVAAMIALGARAERIAAAIGPCIGPGAFEVGPDFVAALGAADPDGLVHLRPSDKPGKNLMDLPAYVAARLARARVGRVEDLALCTYGDPDAFFSFRRATHRAEPDYGRDLSAITLHA